MNVHNEPRDDELRDDELPTAAIVAVERICNRAVPQDSVERTLARFQAVVTSESVGISTQVPTRMGMRSAVSYIAAAVIFVLAVTGVALWFHGSGATPAFADFLEPILEAKTVRYKVTTEMKGPPAITATTEVMMLDATRSRSEMEVEMPDKSKAMTVHIRDGDQGKTLMLQPAKKRATVYNYANMPEDRKAKPSDPFWFRSLLLDTRDKPGVKREPLGEKEIDGRRVVGTRISLPAAVFSVWGDPKTGLPARIEMTVAITPNVKMTMSDFEFNVDMDESLFSVEPPTGYEVIQVQRTPSDKSPSEEKDLIAMFRYYSELSGGRFPDLLDTMWLNQTVRTQRWLADHLVQPPKPMAKRSEEGSEAQAKIQRGMMFTVLLPKEADSHYAGKGVSLGATDTPIFWYRPKDAKTYRVIYADLSVRDADAPPSVPDALPEQDLIDTLRYYSELSGGPFPDSLDLTSFLQNVAMKSLSFDSLQQQDKASLKQMQETMQARMMKDLVKFQPGLIFTASLPPEADSHYAGKGVALGAADTPIFWYRPKDAKAYRVVYADLSVRDAETPPSVPDAQPEEDLIDTFRYFSELSGGPFPDSLDLQTLTEMIGRDFAMRMFLELAPEEQRHKIKELLDLQRLAREKGKPKKEQITKIEEQIFDLLDWERLAPGKGKPNKEQMTKIIEAETQKFMKAQIPKYMAATTRFQRGLLFTTQLSPEADAHYAGKGVSLGAADTPIFWYRPKDAKEYRVIDADLSVREAETPPSVPDAQPVPSSPKK